MKKKLLFLSILLFCGMFTIYSCQDESHSYNKADEGKVLGIEDARTYFENFITDFEVYPLTKVPETRSDQDKRQTEIFPVWKQAKEFDFEGVRTIEIPYSVTFASIHLVSDTLNTQLPFRKKPIFYGSSV